LDTGCRNRKPIDKVGRGREESRAYFKRMLGASRVAFGVAVKKTGAEQKSGWGGVRGEGEQKTKGRRPSLATRKQKAYPGDVEGQGKESQCRHHFLVGVTERPHSESVGKRTPLARRLLQSRMSHWGGEKKMVKERGNRRATLIKRDSGSQMHRKKWR